MKKQLLTIFALSLGTMAIAQVGVNTPTPEATFDITSKSTTGTSVEGLLIPRIDRLKAQSMTNIPTSTMIYVNSIANGTLAGNAVNINSVGYYFYNGTVWSKLLDTNLYNSDGTLTTNRTVTQGARTLAFTGTAANAFSVDGTTFSVNAANNRVGIGTTTPIAPLEVNTQGATAIGIQVIQPVKTGYSYPGIRIAGSADDYAVGQSATIGFNPNSTAGNAPISLGAVYLDSATGEGSADFVVATSQGAPAVPKFTVKNNGMVGVLTMTPQKTFHVAGDLQVTRELNVGGNATTAGSAGTAGQVLVSNGPGNAPSWQAGGSSTSVNIYNTDGILTGNRIVTQDANTLAFTGTAANAFSVDGSTFSVNAANDRVGIGTTAPSAPLEVNTTVAGQVAVQITQPTATVPLPGLRISGASGTAAVGQNAMIGFNPNNLNGAYPVLVGARYLSGATAQGDADFVVATSQGGTAEEKLVVKNIGDVGIGTTTPQKKLHVNGALQVTSELNLGGNATTAGSAGTTGQVLVSNGEGNAPSWQALPSNNPPKAITTDYTLLPEDSGVFIYSSGTSALTITAPTTLPVGFHCVIIQQGTAQVTVTGASGFTLNSARGNKTRTRYSAIGVVKHAGNVGVITGDAVN